MGSYAHKVVLLGNTKVGKTSLLIRKLTNDPISRVNSTIGVSCQTLEIEVGEIAVSLSIWDTAGQEVYYSVVPSYIREAKAALLVCDIADRFSFDRLDWWSKMVTDEVGSSVVLFVVANKIDLEQQRRVSRSALKDFAEQHRAKLFEVSAMMEVHCVHGTVRPASGRGCRIFLFGKDRTIVPTSGVGQDAAVVCRPDAKQIDFQAHRFGREGAAKEATLAQNARADN